MSSSFSSSPPPPTELYTLSLHDALPIWRVMKSPEIMSGSIPDRTETILSPASTAPSPNDTQESIRKTTDADRKSTRLNSSHVAISYAVFCLKKKKAKYNDLKYESNTHTQ